MQFAIDYLESETIIPIADGRNANPQALRQVLATIESDIADGLGGRFRALTMRFDIAERRFQIEAQAQHSNITFRITGHMIGPDSVDPFTPGITLVPVAASRVDDGPFGGQPTEANIRTIWVSVKDRIEAIVAGSAAV